MRALTFLLALAFTLTAAHAQTKAAVITSTPDGFVLSDVSDAPVEGHSSVLLVAPESGSVGWVMQTLQPGERPSDALASGIERREHHEMALAFQRDGTDRHRTIAAYHRARLARRDAARAETDEVEIIEDAEVVGEITDESVEYRLSEPRAILQRIERGTSRSVRFEVVARTDRALDLRDPLVATLAEDDALSGLQVRTTGGITHVEVVFAFETVGDWEAWTETHADTLDAIRDRATDDSLGLKLDIR